MGTMHVFKPTCRYIGVIPGDIRPGLLIRVNGVLRNVGTRLAINIGNGPNDEYRPFHLSVRPNEEIIVRNSYLQRNWGDGERTGGCPIKYGVPFEIFILRDQAQFKIAIDGKHFCDFSHRASVANAKYLVIEGDVQISFIGIEDDPTYFFNCEPLGQEQQLQLQGHHYHHEDCTPPEWKGYPHC